MSRCVAKHPETGERCVEWADHPGDHKDGIGSRFAQGFNGLRVRPFLVAEAELAVQRLLAMLGENPMRDGLVETPARVVKALKEMTGGYAQNPSEILSKVFPVDHDEMVVVSGIDFWSTCEHHLLPFHGTAAVGYIPRPGKGVVGLSKIPRLVECFARRLQMQERLAREVALALQDALDPIGVGVLLNATHHCMCARGVRSRGKMTTSCLLGAMREQPATRAEFLSLAR